MGIAEQIVRTRQTPAEQSINGVEDDHIILVRSRNIRTLGDDIRNGRISIEIAYSVICFWFSVSDRHKWFNESNRETRRRDNQDNLRAALTELSA